MALELLVVIGAMPLFYAFIEGLRGKNVFTMGGPAPRTIQCKLARLLLGELQRGRHGSDAMYHVRLLLDLPWPKKARKAADLMNGNPGFDIPQAAERTGLWSRRIADSGSRAIRQGSVYWRVWLDSFARSCPMVDENQDRRLASFVFSASLMSGMIVFLAIFLFPRMIAFFNDMQIPCPARMQLVMDIAGWMAHWWWLGLAVGMVSSLGLDWWLRVRRERRVVSIIQGRLLLIASSMGLDERRMLDLVGDDGADTCRALDHGNFQAICRRCGWDAASPLELAAEIERCEWRSWRRRTRASLASSVIIPLLLAVPVWIVSTAIFQSFVAVMEALAEAPV